MLIQDIRKKPNINTNTINLHNLPKIILSTKIKQIMGFLSFIIKEKQIFILTPRKKIYFLKELIQIYIKNFYPVFNEVFKLIASFIDIFWNAK